MVQVRQNVAASPLGLLLHCPQVGIDRLADRTSAERLDDFLEIRRVDMDRLTLGAIADLLALY